MHIYFDGGLPVWKRATRFDRLHKDYLQRLALRSQQADFKLNYSNEAPFAAEDLLGLSYACHKSQTNLITPFLVPLVIESLQTSRFLERTEIVPGEADAWCAAFAREHGATILTNDSDLAMYNLGKGQMVFLDSLKKNMCEQCKTVCIMANVIQPAKVAQTFSAKDIRHAAFDLFSIDEEHKDQSHSASTKRHPKKVHTSTTSFTDFEGFCSRYSEITLEEAVHLRKMIQDLDPRLAEIIGQLRRPSVGDIMSTLPLLIEDPQRRSAWTVCESIRGFTYSILQHTSCMEGIILVEHIEKGQPSRTVKAVSLLDERSCIDACIRLVEFLRTIRASSHDTGDTTIYWRTVCSIHVCYHLLASELSSSTVIQPQLSAKWDRLQSNANLSWSHIHFRGQLEATYYGFRQLHQILKYLELRGSLNKFHCLPALRQEMMDLPGIVDMFEETESNSKQTVDSEYVMKLAREMVEV